MLLKILVALNTPGTAKSLFLLQVRPSGLPFFLEEYDKLTECGSESSHLWDITESIQ